MAEWALGMETSLGEADRTARVSLVSRAQQGDIAAFETLLRLHERRVLGTAYRLLGKLEDAQDAAQEVFLRMHSHLSSFDSDDRLVPWLYRVTVNVCYDLGRNRKLRGGAASLDLLREDSGFEVQSPQASPETESLEQERQRLVEQGLQVLSDRERAALILRDLEGLTADEVGNILGISGATIRSHIASARIKLRQFVKQRMGMKP